MENVGGLHPTSRRTLTIHENLISYRAKLFGASTNQSSSHSPRTSNPLKHVDGVHRGLRQVISQHDVGDGEEHGGGGDGEGTGPPAGAGCRGASSLPSSLA